MTIPALAPASTPASNPARALFAERAGRLAGIAAVVAGWRPDEFWRATPAELEAVLTAFFVPATGAAPPLDAALLDSLKERFPDG